MWEHLSDEEQSRRQQVLIDQSRTDVLHALAFARGDLETSASLLSEYLGRELDEIEDPRSEPMLLAERFMTLRHDPFSEQWYQLAANVAVPASIASDIVSLSGPSSPLDSFDDEICAEVAGNPMVPRELASALVRYTAQAFYGDDDEFEPDRVPSALLGNVGLSMEALRVVTQHLGLPAAQNMSIPISWMEEIFSSDQAFRPVLARNIMLPPHLSESLLATDCEPILYALSRNPSVPSEVLQALAGNPIRDVRLGVAENPSTPSLVLASLLGDEDEIVVARVSRHANAPVEVRRQLSESDSVAVRSHVAGCALTPPDVLARLARDADPVVRSNVATNRATEAEVLRVLAGDAEDRVRVSAYRNPGLPDDLRGEEPPVQVRPAVSARRRLSWAANG